MSHLNANNNLHFHSMFINQKDIHANKNQLNISNNNMNLRTHSWNNSNRNNNNMSNNITVSNINAFPNMNNNYNYQHQINNIRSLPITWSSKNYESASIVDIGVPKIENLSNSNSINSISKADLINNSHNLKQVKHNLDIEANYINKEFNFDKYSTLKTKLEKNILNNEENSNPTYNSNNKNTKTKFIEMTKDIRFNDIEEKEYGVFKKEELNQMLIKLIMFNKDFILGSMDLKSSKNNPYIEMFNKQYKNKHEINFKENDFENLMENLKIGDLNNNLTDARSMLNSNNNNDNSNYYRNNSILNENNPYKDLFSFKENKISNSNNIKKNNDDFLNRVSDKKDNNDNLDNFSLFLDNEFNKITNKNNNNNLYTHKKPQELSQEEKIYAQKLILVPEFKHIINNSTISDEACVFFMMDNMINEYDFKPAALAYFKTKYNCEKIRLKFRVNEIDDKFVRFNFTDSPDDLISKAFEIKPDFNDMPTFYLSDGKKLDLTKNHYIGSLGLEMNCTLKLI